MTVCVLIEDGDEQPVSVDEFTQKLDANTQSARSFLAFVYTAFEYAVCKKAFGEMVLSTNFVYMKAPVDLVSQLPVPSASAWAVGIDDMFRGAVLPNYVKQLERLVAEGRVDLEEIVNPEEVSKYVWPDREACEREERDYWQACDLARQKLKYPWYKGYNARKGQMVGVAKQPFITGIVSLTEIADNEALSVRVGGELREQIIDLKWRVGSFWDRGVCLDPCGTGADKVGIDLVNQRVVVLDTNSLRMVGLGPRGLLDAIDGVIGIK